MVYTQRQSDRLFRGTVKAGRARGARGRRPVDAPRGLERLREPAIPKFLLALPSPELRATRPQLFSKAGVRTRSPLVWIVLGQHRDQLQRGSPWQAVTGQPPDRSFG